MAVIVNADDFGMSRSVNEAIALAFERGLIDRTTLMTNMPDAAEAMKMAEDAGFIDRVGIHINLTSGMPLTDGILHDPLMCDPGTGFNARFVHSMKTRFFFPGKTGKCVEAELRAQLDRFRELGGKLWHVDSHHYVHTNPSVWHILKRVFADYPVVSVRLGRNMYTDAGLPMRIYKAVLNSSIKRYCRGRPEYFGSGEDFGRFCEKYPDLAARAEMEVMVHPVFDEEGTLSDVFEDRFRKLTRPAVPASGSK